MSLDSAQTVTLDEIAHGQGILRAELVRRPVDRGIGSTPVDQEADLTAIVDSFGVMAGDLLDRGPDERAAHLDGLRHG